MEMVVMKRNGVVRRWMALPVVCVLLSSGCNQIKSSDLNYARAIDQYYSSHASCLFEEPVKLPLEGDRDDRGETARLDALVNQSVLTRSSGEKTMRVLAGAQADEYELSSAGHSSWVADAKQPGYGNLCYGRRKVVSIDSSTPTNGGDGATTTVVYRYSVNDVPSWARAAGVQAAFPALKADLSGRQVGRATLGDTRDGWKVTAAPWAHIEDSDIYR